ncbi:MAG: hypothetical protein WC710_15105 [Gallionella sp.]|jgi:hypothetical protein
MTKKQVEALEKIKVILAGKPKLTEAGNIATGINSITLGNLQKKGLILADLVFSGGVVKGLRLP